MTVMVVWSAVNERHNIIIIIELPSRLDCELVVAGGRFSWVMRNCIIDRNCFHFLSVAVTATLAYRKF